MKETKNIPFIVYESEMQSKTTIIKGLIILSSILVLVLGITIYLFVSFIGSYDYSKYSQNGNGVNNVNSGTQGNITNESNTNITN